MLLAQRPHVETQRSMFHRVVIFPNFYQSSRAGVRVGKELVLNEDKLGLESQLCQLPAVWTWRNYLTFRNFSFFTCEI